MSKSVLIVIIVIGSALWVWGLWRRGFFGPETLPFERRVCSIRLARLMFKNHAEGQE